MSDLAINPEDRFSRDAAHFEFSCVSGLDKIEFLQSHENREIYQKAFDMIERYFGTEEEDRAIAPEVDQNSEQYQFNAAQNAPMGGFQF